MSEDKRLVLRVETEIWHAQRREIERLRQVNADLLEAAYIGLHALKKHATQLYTRGDRIEKVQQAIADAERASAAEIVAREEDDE